jgi:hypothetical protein
MKSRRPLLLARRAAGFLWLLAWMVLLYAVAAPWRDLGGIVDERLRWLEWFVLVTGLSVGFITGRFGRDVAGPGSGRAHVHLLRFLLYPFALLTVLALFALTLLGERDPVGVVVTAFLAYWAGLDLAFGALPLMEGGAYGFLRPLDSDPPVERARGDTSWVPPWERY